MRESLSKLKKISPHRKIVVTSKSPVGNISVVTLIRTDTTLDHSQKAEKVCPMISSTPLNAGRKSNIVLVVNVCTILVGGSSQACHLLRNTAMDDSIGGS